MADCIQNEYLKVNSEHTLEYVMLPSRITQTRCQELEEEDLNTCDNVAHDQTKIAPLKSLSSDNNLSGIMSLMCQKLTDDAELIIVMSSIDSMNNSGDLEKTVEMFCGKRMSEKWVQIKEVKADALRDYLLEMSSLGWKIVGTKQTTGSDCLTDVKFQKKTVLVLR